MATARPIRWQEEWKMSVVNSPDVLPWPAIGWHAGPELSPRSSTFGLNGQEGGDRELPRGQSVVEARAGADWAPLAPAEAVHDGVGKKASQGK
jgi:hypothetical protein